MSEATTDTAITIPLPLERPPTYSPFLVRSFGLTDKGRVRPANEDHFAVVELVRTLHVYQTSVPNTASRYGSPRGHLFLVADGMGGHRAGEVASALTIKTIDSFLLNTLNRFFNLKPADEHVVMKEFQGALLRADSRIFEEAVSHPELEGMGTTLTLAFAVDWKLFVAHAGDSRAYLFSRGELRQLTRDHTLVAEMVRRGTLSPREASTHPYRSMVTNVLGGHEQGVLVEMHRLTLEPDDVLLLCSDGLTGMLPDERIATILTEEREPESACNRLIAEANAQGGRDNITAVVSRFEA